MVDGRRLNGDDDLIGPGSGIVRSIAMRTVPSSVTVERTMR